jgi:ABC-type multidrug transport system ATPase subunit
MKITIQNVKKIYKARTVVDIDTLELAGGRIYAVLGPNGSGKTTLLRLLAGQVKAEEGSILYNGSECLPAEHIAYLPQKPYMFDLTVLDNVLLGMDRSSAARSKAMDVLKSLDMQDFAPVRATSLSGGEAQKIAFARTLVLGKRLVLLDEPSSSIDIASIRLMEECMVKTAHRYGSTMILTTHNPSQAERIAEEVLILYNGNVIERGEPQYLLRTPQKEETKEFLRYV